MNEPATPPPDEYATFRRLTQKLVTVPKKEIDEKRAAEQAAKGKRPVR